MHAKPDLHVVLEWKIAGSGSVIADVIHLGLSIGHAHYFATIFTPHNLGIRPSHRLTSFLVSRPHIATD